ncbi:MAG: hypothetical protein WAX69_22160, partial [Victivallales bacterium]
MKVMIFLRLIPARALGMALLAMLLLPGCIAFPVGTGVVVSQSDSQPRTVSEKRTPLSGQSSEFAPATTELHNVYVSTVGVTNMIERETVIDHTVKKADKIFLIGFFPGICTNWVVGKPATKSYAGDIGQGFGGAVATALLGGIPMIIGWFEEGKSEWEPVDFENGKGDKFRWTRTCIIGWGKSGRTYNTTTSLPQPLVKLEKTEPLPSGEALITIHGTSLQYKAMTDKEGRLVIDPSLLPVRTQKPLLVRSEYSSKSPVIKPQEILIPAESFGTRLFDDNTLKTISFNKFLYFEEEFDFSYVEGQAGAKLTASIEYKGPDAGDSRMVQVTVTNQGAGTCYRLLGKTLSSFAALNEQLLFFGTVKPGQSVTRAMKVSVPPPAFDDAVLPFTIQFKDACGAAPPQDNGSIVVKSLPRPKFSITAHIEKEDGVVCEKIKKGDDFTLVVDVANTGEVAARSGNFTLTLPDDKSLKSFSERKVDLPTELAPG